MNPITSPTAMTVVNGAVTAYGLLESTGMINLLGQKGGIWAIILLGALNGIAHAVSPSTPGPLGK